MKTIKLTIELGTFEDLDTVEVDLFQRMNLSAFFSDFLTDIIADKFFDELLYIALFHFFLDFLNHLGSDQFSLLTSSIRSFSDLLGFSESVSDAENSKRESINGLAVYKCLDEGTPFSNGVKGLITMEMISIELSITPVTLDLFDTEIELFPIKK